MPFDHCHISVGAGFENDRRSLGQQAALSLVDLEGPRFLIFECLAERTLALQTAQANPSALAERAISFLQPCIKTCYENGILIVSNFGGPDPIYVADSIRRWLLELNLPLRVCAITGDAIPIDDPVTNDDKQTIACNAYTGARGIAKALAQGADIVVTGRVADPSLVLGPAVDSLGLDWQDWDALANATMAGHLIECGTQVCGGFFADQGSEVPKLAELGPPVATVYRDRVDLSKPLGGGVLNRSTVTQQLLYEIHNPAAYLTPDVILDITGVSIDENSSEIIRVAGARGHRRPDTLKTLTMQKSGWLGEAEISFMGATAPSRAQIAAEILDSQMAGVRGDYLLEIFDGKSSNVFVSRLRAAIRSSEKNVALALLDAVEALYLNGPAGGGGVRRSLTPMTHTLEGRIASDKISYDLHWGN